MLFLFVACTDQAAEASGDDYDSLQTVVDGYGCTLGIEAGREAGAADAESCDVGATSDGSLDIYGDDVYPICAGLPELGISVCLDSVRFMFDRCWHDGYELGYANLTYAGECNCQE